MILKVHLQGAPCYEVGDEIWQQSLADAIAAEAETIADYANADPLQSARHANRDARDRIIAGMTAGAVWGHRPRRGTVGHTREVRGRPRYLKEAVGAAHGTVAVRRQPRSP